MDGGRGLDTVETNQTTLTKYRTLCEQQCKRLHRLNELIGEKTPSRRETVYLEREIDLAQQEFLTNLAGQDILELAFQLRGKCSVENHGLVVSIPILADTTSIPFRNMQVRLAHSDNSYSPQQPTIPPIPASQAALLVLNTEHKAFLMRSISRTKDQLYIKNQRARVLANLRPLLAASLFVSSDPLEQLEKKVSEYHSATMGGLYLSIGNPHHMHAHTQKQIGTPYGKFSLELQEIQGNLGLFPIAHKHSTELATPYRE